MTTNHSKYWEEVYALISKRKIEQAMMMCELEPYAAVVECQRFLGWEYYERGSQESALEWFGKAAKQRDVESVFGMGCVHGVLGNYTASALNFQEAMGNGYGRACYWLGCLYYHGKGVPKDEEKALYLFKCGAEQGFLGAERQLIDQTYLNGDIRYVLMLFKRIVIILKVLKKIFMLRTMTVHDPRIMDMPNAFKKYKKDNIPHSSWVWYHE
jgi:TPR repeat protein